MQLTYNDSPAAARKGMIGDGGALTAEVIAALMGEDIVHGRFVTDQFDGSVLLPAADASTDKLLGILVASHAIESVNDGEEPTVKSGTQGNILRKGRIWVWCEEAFDPSSDVLHVRFTANGAGKYPGQVLAGVDGGKADELGASGYGVTHRVLNALTEAGLLQIEINLP
jgi:hypothetical protein